MIDEQLRADLVSFICAVASDVLRCNWDEEKVLQSLRGKLNGDITRSKYLTISRAITDCLQSAILGNHESKYRSKLKLIATSFKMELEMSWKIAKK